MRQLKRTQAVSGKAIRLQKADEIIIGLSRFLLGEAMKRPQPQSQMGGIDVNYFPVREAVLQNVFCVVVFGDVEQ